MELPGCVWPDRGGGVLHVLRIITGMSLNEGE
jgi:hypothetical protein